MNHPIGAHHTEEIKSEIMIANFDVIIEEKKWEDPYDSIWLQLVTILVYIIEGRHLSINILVSMETRIK